MIEICLVSYSRPERLPIIKEQLKNQTYKDFRLNIWDNTKYNIGSKARFWLAKETEGNPIIFIDDDESLEPDFVEYMYKRWNAYPNAIQGWFTRIFPFDSYWDSFPYSPEDTEVDYVGTGGMILDRKIIDEEDLYNIPKEFEKVEDLWLSYLARKRGQKLLAVEPHIKIEVDGKDQFKGLGDYKNEAFRLLREKYQWKLLKD